MRVEKIGDISLRRHADDPSEPGAPKLPDAIIATVHVFVSNEYTDEGWDIEQKFITTFPMPLPSEDALRSCELHAMRTLASELRVIADALDAASAAG